MEHLEQVEIVKRALELEQRSAEMNKKMISLRTSHFKEAPAAPVKAQIKRIYPEATPTIKFNWPIAIIISIFTTIIGGIIYYCYYKKQREKETEEIRNSPEFKKRWADADAAFNKAEAEANEKHNKEKYIYDSITMPEYRANLGAWECEREKAFDEAQNILNTATNELEKLYSNSALIPLQYRKIPALQYIYDMISTSDYSVKDAIESYDKMTQRELEKARLEAQEQTNRLTSMQNELTQEQNDILNEQNDLTDRVRRNANAAAAVATAQRHKIIRNMKK